MAKDTVAIKLDGNVSLADFRIAVDAFSDLISALSAEVNPNADIDWIVADLRGGSATIVNRGFFHGNAESETALEAVVDRFNRLGLDAETGTLDDYSQIVRETVWRLSSIVNGRIPAIHFGTDDKQFTSTIKRSLEPVDQPQIATDLHVYRPMSRASIKGRIVSLDDKHGTYFSLSEAYTGRIIRCYPTDKWRVDMARYWTTKEYVFVEGSFARYNQGPTMTAITDIVPLGEAHPGGWRQAIGCAPRHPQGSDALAADGVRKVRDGEE